MNKLGYIPATPFQPADFLALYKYMSDQTRRS